MLKRIALVFMLMLPFAAQAGVTRKVVKGVGKYPPIGVPAKGVAKAAKSVWHFVF